MNEEDIKILEEKINNIKKYNTYRYGWTETDVQTVENLINRNKEIEEENEIYKEELEKIDKVLNLEAGRAAPYRYEIIESLQRGITQLKKIIDNSIPVSLVEEKLEKEKLPNIIVGGRRNAKTLEYGKKLGRIEMCEELLEKRKQYGNRKNGLCNTK